MTILYIYLLIALAIYLIGLMYDITMYYKGYDSTKFPLLAPTTHKVMIAVSFLWLPILLGLIYAYSMRND